MQVIEDVLRDLVKNGIDQKALAGRNQLSTNSDIREADFGNYPKGLMYGLQVMDSWLV